jgi:SIR2-like domain
MDSVHTYASDIAFTASVKAIQTRIGFAAPISTWRNEAPGRHGSRPIWHALSRRRRAFSRHREREGTALYPASRRPAWLSQGARRQDPRPCRFRRQSAIHHVGQSHGQPQGASFLDRLYAAAAHQDPLIFAAEDYRTYPIRHAAFVNLARQIFIENDLCLLGFSGNDPNFLEWAGWVRDHLGGHARRIYLAGYLDLSASARRYLETHNIAPIDLAPLVNHLPKNERYSVATKIFLDVLRTEQPPAPAVWKRHASNEYPLRSQEDHQKVYKDASFAAEVLEETARLLRDDRESYPGWLVCPREERRHPRFGYGLAIFKPAVLAHINPPELAEILNEFLWHYTISFTGLPLMFRDALASIMNESSPPIERGARLKFAVALIRDARVEGNDGNFEKWSAIVDTEADADAPERLEAQYQRCLRLRDQLDLSGLRKSLNALDSESPLWRLRQAGLYAELGQYEKATKLIKNATAEFEKAYRLDRNSMWVKSGLAWASWLNRVAHMGNFARRGELPQAREFRHVKVDPADELEKLENSADELRRKEQEDDVAIIPLFDPGSFLRGTQKVHAQPGDPRFEYLYELDQLMERTGVSMRINHVQLAAGAATKIAKVTYHHDVSWYLWLLRSLHSHFDNLFVRYFGRIAIAQLPEDVAGQLRQKLDASIAFWHNRNALSIGEERAQDRSLSTSCV